MTADLTDKPGLDLETLMALEEQLGSKLPKDYRTFLLAHNGGIPKRKYFSGYKPFMMWVDDFISIDANLATPSEESRYDTLAFAMARFGRMIPKDALVVGWVGRDNPLLLFYRGPRRGELYLKDLQELPFPPEDLWEKKPEMGLHRVATSFSTFLEALHDTAS